MAKKLFDSLVLGHEGLCKPTWICKNIVEIRTTGAITGCFKNVKKHWLWGYVRRGKEFHGYIDSKGKIRTTEGIYSSSQFT